MDLSYFITSLTSIQPELMVLATLLVVLVFDLIFKQKKTFIPYIALAGLVATFFFLINQFGISQTAFITSEETQFGMFSLDPFSTFFKFIIVVSSFLVILMSISSSEIKNVNSRSGEYYTLIFGMILGMMFLASANDLILIYISLELLSLSSYVLAGFLKKDRRPSEAAMKYLIFGSISSAIMLFGISLFYGLFGTTNLNEIASFGSVSGMETITLTISTIFIFAGIGYKISSVPFHFWTPDVYEGAPIPITAYLSVASKSAGFALLVRFVRVGFTNTTLENGFWMLLDGFDWQLFLTIIAIATMTIGNLIALWQDNLKRMLAYSSIAHAGYLIAALVAFNNESLLAILVYFTFYLLMNFGAFYVIMVVKNKHNTEDINDYDALGTTSPFLAVVMTFFLFSLSGVPPFAGFIGKLYIFIALVDAKLLVLAVIALLNSTVSVYYYMRVLKHMFLTKKTDTSKTVEVDLFDKVVLLALAIPTLVFGLYFSGVVNLAQNSINILGF